MSDVFISYARPDEPLAARVGEALEAAGYQVWRDAELPVHRAYSEVIEERLRGAKAVVVLWSAEAAKSQWVRAEADAARELGTLVQARIDSTIPPLPFNQIQCADLKDWAGEEGHAGWRKLAASLEALAGRVDAGKAPHRPRRAGASICVLPFANMSGDVEQEYFSDGISEDITTDLSKVSALAVVARNTAFTFKGKAVDVSDIARKLGVSHVLEGSVRKAGNRVRITAQLIDGQTGDHVWADRFDRDLTDIFAIQDELSSAIVAALKLKLLPEEKKAIEHRGTNSPEAYNMYLMARQYWATGNYGDVRREERVIRICERAVELDPHYARAWALMAIAQVNLCFSFGRTEEDGRLAAERALSLDPNVAEAHCVNARHLAESGRFDKAEEEVALALRLDPESWEVNREAARLYYRQGRMSDAARYFADAVRIMASDFHAWGMLASCYHALGDVEGVNRAAINMVSRSEKVIAEDPSNAAALGILAGGLAILGQTERAKEWIERALLIDPDNLNLRYNFACVTAVYLKDADAAMDLLEPTFARTTGALVRNALVDPDLDNLRGLPRFQQMLATAQERLGIPTPNPAATSTPPRS